MARGTTTTVPAAVVEESMSRPAFLTTRTLMKADRPAVHRPDRGPLPLGAGHEKLSKLTTPSPIPFERADDARRQGSGLRDEFRLGGMGRRGWQGFVVGGGPSGDFERRSGVLTGSLGVFDLARRK